MYLNTALMFVGSLALAIGSGEYLYRDRRLVSAVLVCLSLLAFVVSVVMWAHL